MKKILFVTYGGGHVNIVKSLYPKLKDEYDISIIALTVAGNVLNKSHIQYKKIKEYIDLFGNDKKTIIKYGESLANSAYNSSSGIEYDDLVAYLGMSLWDLCNELGDEEKAFQSYLKEGRAAFNPVNVMKKIIEFERPDLLIVTCDVRMEKAAGIAANEIGVPVLRILNLMECNFMPYKCNICVMNDLSKKIMVSKFPEKIDQVFVTGQPAFDENRIINKVDMECFRNKYFIREFRNVIIFFAQTYQYEMQLSICERIGQIVSNHASDLFIVKLHPNDSSGILTGTENKDNFYVIKDEIETRTLLNVCTLAMTMDSTVGLEAVLLDRPLLLINTQDVALDIDFSKYDIAEKCTDIDELESMIYKNLYNGETIAKMRAKRRKFNTESDAASKIVAVVKKIIN